MLSRVKFRKKYDAFYFNQIQNKAVHDIRNSFPKDSPYPLTDLALVAQLHIYDHAGTEILVKYDESEHCFEVRQKQYRASLFKKEDFINGVKYLVNYNDGDVDIFTFEKASTHFKTKDKFRFTSRFESWFITLDQVNSAQKLSDITFKKYVEG